MTTVSIAFRVNTDSQQQHFTVTTDIADVSSPSPPQFCYGGYGRPVRLRNRWRMSWCCDSCEDGGSHDDGCTDISHNAQFAQVGDLGSRWRSDAVNDSNDIPSSVSTDTQGSSSAQAGATIECRHTYLSPPCIRANLSNLPRIRANLSNFSRTESQPSTTNSSFTHQEGATTLPVSL